VSNYDRSRGSSCLAEKRMLELLESGKPTTPFLKFGDRVAIEMRDARGNNLFGTLDNQVIRSA
jgi:fumarylacetoacetate (FAA) hydrolase